MSSATSQQINLLYNTYRSIDVTFTKEVAKASGLIPQNVFIKCLGEQWPCVVYPSSLEGAKVLATTKPGLNEKIAKSNNLISLRYSFKVPYKQDPVSFFVSAKASGFAPYVQSNGTLQFISIQYSQRPPDDFVEIIGTILEANMNAARRRDERIILSAEAMRKINLPHKEAMVLIQGVPRRCIIRDLSFGGTKLIIVGLAKFLVGKEAVVRVDFDEPRETIDIPAKVVRYEDVEGRKDLTAIALQFEPASTPMSYKMHINNYNPLRRKADDEAPASAKLAAATPAAATKEAAELDEVGELDSAPSPAPKNGASSATGLAGPRAGRSG